MDGDAESCRLVENSVLAVPLAVNSGESVVSGLPELLLAAVSEFVGMDGKAVPDTVVDCESGADAEPATDSDKTPLADSVTVVLGEADAVGIGEGEREPDSDTDAQLEPETLVTTVADPREVRDMLLQALGEIVAETPLLAVGDEDERCVALAHLDGKAVVDAVKGLLTLARPVVLILEHTVGEAVRELCKVALKLCDAEGDGDTVDSKEAEGKTDAVDETEIGDIEDTRDMVGDTEALPEGH